MKAIYYKKLKNGIRVIGERNPHVNAVSIAFSVMVGSRNEKKDTFGISHLLEHVVFKATKKYSAFELVDILEVKGGELNAFTSKENTCFYSYGLSEDLPKAVDVLCEIVFRAKLDKKDFELEKEVVKQEILMSYDNPEDKMFDHFTELFYEDSPLAHPIFGSEKSLDTISLAHLKSHYKAYYQPKNLVVAVAGNFEWDELLDLLNQKIPSRKSPALPRKRKQNIKAKPFVHFEHKDLGQVHSIIGIPSHGVMDGIQYPVSLLISHLSGGMNSVLYQELREKRALCYSVSASYGPSEQMGCISLYSSCSPEKLVELTRRSFAILKNLKEKSISSRQLKRLKEQVRCSLLLGESDLESRMNALMFDECFEREHRSIAEVVEDIEKVQLSDFNNYLKRYFRLNEASLYLLGPITEKQKLEVQKLINSVRA